jgi:hypothetical protein
MTRTKSTPVKEIEYENPLPIETLFYIDREVGWVRKVNRAKHRRTAIMNATDKLDNDIYAGAWLAVIYDTTYGTLIRIIVKRLNGRVEVMFEDDPKKPSCLIFITDNIANDNYRVAQAIAKSEE